MLILYIPIRFMTGLSSFHTLDSWNTISISIHV